MAMGRPRKVIDKEKLKQLAQLGLSNTEIGAVLDCSPDHIETKYRKTLDWGRSRRNASLRRKQYEIAMSGNPTMLIWLGKQFLGQSDKNELTGPEGAPLLPSITLKLVRPEENGVMGLPPPNDLDTKRVC